MIIFALFQRTKLRKKRLSLRRKFEQIVCEPANPELSNGSTWLIISYQDPLGKSKEMLLQSLELNGFLQMFASALLKIAQGYKIISGVLRAPVII
jgi:hypothetical protein